VQTPVTVTGDNWYQFAHGEATAHDAIAPHGEATAHDAVAPHGEATAHDAVAPHDGSDAPEVIVPHAGQETLAHETHAAHLSAMFVSMLLAFSGIGVAFLMYKKKVIDPDRIMNSMKPLHTFLMNKWYFDEIYEKWIVVPGVHLVARMMYWFDAHIVDGAVNGVATITQLQARISGLFDKWVVDGAVNGVAYTAGFFGILLKKTQTGKIQAYIAFILAGVMVLFYAFF
jgi:NADH-quinone oxidoreductase subunit L